MTTWYTADLHVSHVNILALCNRPFADAAEMNAALIERWNDAVAPAGTVWVLGDVALGVKNLGPVAALHGRKILIAGNHDDCWDRHKRWRRAVRTYLDAGFERVEPTGVVYGHRLEDGTRVNLSHLPYRGDSHERDRYAEHRPVDDGLPLLCGHVHDRWRASGRQINVGVDVWHYRPAPERILCGLIATLPPAAG